MSAKPVDARVAPFFYMVTFEIDPRDEMEFNEIYNTEHIPNLLKVDGVLGVIRFRDAERNDRGWLVYSALYLIAQADLPSTPRWKAASEIGRWAQLMRPRLKSRAQRLGSIVATDFPDHAH